MSQPVYGGVSAIVIDQGSMWTRAGYAGEDTPKAVVPSRFGQIDDKYYFGDNDLYFTRPNMEIKSTMQDGIVQDWDGTSRLWEYCLKDVLAADMNEHPLLITEQIWNTDENRQKAMEIAFETLDVAAFYIVKRPVCSMFAAGKGSGLIIDVGASCATVTPIIDGLVLYKPSQRSKIAGDYVSEYVKEVLEKSYQTKIEPRYIARAQANKSKIPENITESAKQLQVASILDEFKESMVQVRDTKIQSNTDLSDEEARVFDLPDRTQLEVSGADRLKIGERLFEPDGSAREENEKNEKETEKDKTNEKKDGEKKKEEDQDEMDLEPDPTENMSAKDKEMYTLVHTDRRTTRFRHCGVSDMAVRSINACDVDIRANLANNIVVTGGTSLLQGFTDRLNEDLTNGLAGYKIRMHAPGNAVERKYSAWIGGSILASLGTFHQLWISKKEYQEVGAAKLLQKRFR